MPQKMTDLRNVFAKPHAILCAMFAITLLTSGCSTTSTRSIRLASNVDKTTVRIGGNVVGTVGVTNRTIEFEGSGKSKQVKVVLEKNNYFPAERVVSLEKSPTELGRFNLVPKTMKKTFDISSLPSGAKVLLDGSVIGSTSLSEEIEFARPSPGARFEARTLTFSLSGYQTESVTLDPQDHERDTYSVSPVQLARLRHEKTLSFWVVAQSYGGQREDPVVVDASLDGRPLGKTTGGRCEVTVEFTRASKTQPWSTHVLTFVSEDEFVAREIVLSYDQASGYEPQKVILDPVTRYNITHYRPVVDLHAQGPNFKVIAEQSVASRDEAEPQGSPIRILVPVTQFERSKEKNPEGYINSFTPTPDGQSVIYSVTQQEESGYSSGLFHKSIHRNEPTVLQSDEEIHYLHPRFASAHEEKDINRFLMFLKYESKRNRQSLVVHSADLEEDYRLKAGWAQLTQDEDFFYWEPSFSSDGDQTYFVRYPKRARPRPGIAFKQEGSEVEVNTSIEGNHPQVHRDDLYYSKRDKKTGKMQIYRMNFNEKEEVNLLYGTPFMNSNCTAPALSPNGEKLIFVSDVNDGVSDLANTNLYLMDLSKPGREPKQLTFSESEDIAPAWVPNLRTPYPNRIFFLSNRGGAFNVWYFDD